MNPTIRVLILDDDLAVVDTICTLLTRMGLDACGETEPRHFLSRAATWQPDFIVLDLMMPDMDGVEIIRRLAEMENRAAVILASGVGTQVLEAARRTAVERGLHVAGIAAKPLRQSKLMELIEASLQVPRSPPDDAAKATVDAKALAEALERGDLYVAFQPQVDCLNHDLVGFEALCRWTHPEHGAIPPQDFVELAERSGLIDQLAAMVINSSLGFLASSQAPEGAGLSINLSMSNLADVTLPDRLAAQCATLEIAATRVTFELTETGVMTDPASTLDLLTRLRMKGFCLAIDDFGTGYSSMVQLVRLPATEIKIDKSFVLSSRTSSESQEVVRSVVALGKALGLEVVVEGIEDDDTLAFVSDLGCHRMQGYLFARALRAEEVQPWLSTRKICHGPRSRK